MDSQFFEIQFFEKTMEKTMKDGVFSSRKAVCRLNFTKLPWGPNARGKAVGGWGDCLAVGFNTSMGGPQGEWESKKPEQNWKKTEIQETLHKSGSGLMFYGILVGGNGWK